MIESGTIKVRLREMIKQREIEWGRDITYAELNEATGISMSTISDWVTGKTEERIYISVLAKLCAFLNCEPGDLLVYVPGGKDHGNQTL